MAALSKLTAQMDRRQDALLQKIDRMEHQFDHS
jgi:hypothetical protein